MKKHFLVRRCLLAVLAVVLVAGISACSGGGGGGDTGTLDSNTTTTTTTNGEVGTTTNPGPVSANSVNQVQLTGTIAAGAGAQGLSGMRAAAVADAVWAVPIAKMQGANIDPVNFMLRKTASLATDGTFSFQLAKTITLQEILVTVPNLDAGGMPADTVFDVDWLLVQMAGATPVNVIQLQGDATYDGMLSLPLSAFTPTTMDLGSISSASGVAALSVSGLASNVTISASSLALMARSDDILATIKDVIRNCDLNTNKCISAQQSFVFMGDYAQITHAANYARAGAYSGYQFYFDVVDYFNKADFDGICPESGSSATVVYTLSPPSPVSVESVTYSNVNPLSTGTSGTNQRNNLNDGAYTECFKQGAPLYLRKDNATQDWNLQFITGDEPQQLTTATPAGNWTLARSADSGANFATIANFEFALANPVDGTGNPIVFVPAIRFDTDGAGGLTTLHVKWYQHNGANYVEVTDAALLNSLMGGFEVAMDDFNGIETDGGTRRSAHANNISFGTASVDVSNLDTKGKFLYNSSSTTAYNLDYTGISYQFGGQSFRFVWRPTN